jgi:oligoendopeptidase F
MAFTSNPDKQIQFADTLDNLILDGNLFRGDYGGAFVTYFSAFELPIAYFGPGYSGAFTVVHEFGHYMNEIYNNSEFDQSYDLLEMHSQGNELLYLCYLKENAEMSSMVHNLVETHALVNMFYAVIAGMTIDSFEQALYLNEYEGTNADQIMADGKIAPDEYDLLYAGICADYGAADALAGYWRGGMTVQSPCYYVSYSVSAISVLQLYEIANTDGFDAAKDSYLKLFTYVDEDTEMTMEEILEYAGLLSFEDEELYKNLKDYMLK